MTDAALEAKLGFDKVRRSIVERCMTQYAADRASTENFSDNPSTIRERLSLSDEMRLVLMFEENFPTGGYIDALPFLAPLLKDGSNIDALNLAKLRTLTGTIGRIVRFFSGIRPSVYPGLKRMSSQVQVFPEVTRRIDAILDSHGEIADNASDELQQIRRRLSGAQASISKKAEAILRRAQQEGLVEEDAAVNIRDGKFLIPVPSSSKRKLPGFIYDESSSGRTSFIEPVEIVELENEIAALHFEEEREIARILHEFTEFVRPYVPELMDGARFVGEMDFLIAKVKVAQDYVSGMPVISEDGRLELRKARHPLLEKALHREGRQIVPLTVSLDRSKHILLISGPNAGGKSVCLKTVGLLQYMFQCGLLIPTSESSELPVFDRILVSIGDDQSLENDLSTYSSFLANMRRMLDTADNRTLVLIDEFGSGTEPAAGGAIAEAILAELDRRGVYGVVTTHYTNLKLFASGSDCGVVNGAMQFDASRIEPLFKLEMGMPGNSFAFEMARKMRLPETIVKDAERRAGEDYVDIERNLRRIVRNRRALDEKLAKIKHTDKTLEGITERYQKELEEIKGQRNAILDEARQQAEDIVRGAGAQVEKTIRTIKEAQAEKERTRKARTELQNFLGAIQEKKEKENSEREEYINRKLSKLGKRRGQVSPAVGDVRREEPLKVGEKVRVTDSGMVGEVIKVSLRSVTLVIGNISSTMSPDKVRRISSNEFREESRRLFPRREQAPESSLDSHRLDFRPELDVRGERLQDALDRVVHYIDDAVMLGMDSVRIIHGKGTGVLREEIQKYLRSIPGIEVRDEDVRIGGTGVTVVKF